MAEEKWAIDRTCLEDITIFILYYAIIYFFLSLSPLLPCSLWRAWFLITCISLFFFFLIKGWRLGRQCRRGQWRPHSCWMEDKSPSFQQSLHPFLPSPSHHASTHSPPPPHCPANLHPIILLSQSWLLSPPSSWVASFCPSFSPSFPHLHTPHLHLINHSLHPLIICIGGPLFYTSALFIHLVRIHHDLKLILLY